MPFLRRSLSAIKTFAIQLAVFAVLCGLLEVGARYAEPSLKKGTIELGLHPFPYFMLGAGSHQENLVWENAITNEPIRSKVKFNNYGYVENFDYQMAPTADYLRKYAKRPGETLVMITGGSVVHGVGATANDRTIAAQLERHLNEGGNGHRYRVINMGMGGWIAYQQFIGLSLFGLPLNPDWIIVMDGHNDGQSACAHASGVGNPILWPRLLYFMNGGRLSETNETVEAIARRSALFRLVSGIEPQERPGPPQGLVIDEHQSDKRFMVRVGGLKNSVQNDQLDFYIQSQRDVLALFSHANVILSTQPLMSGNAVSEAYRTAFGPDATPAIRAKLTADLDRYMAENGDKPCETKGDSQTRAYFMARSGFMLEELAAEETAANPSRKVSYINAESAFPFDLKLRAPYFTDNAHMSDAGQDRIGAMFADAILSTERGARFDYAAFVKESGSK